MSLEYAQLHPPEPGVPSRRPPRRVDARPIWKWLITLFIGVFLVLATGGFMVAMAEEKMGLLWQAFPFLLLLVFSSTAILLRNWRQRDAAATLFYVAEAVRMNLPLPAFLHAAAASERGRLSRRLRKLSGRLVSGEPLASALSVAEPVMSTRVLATIESAERSGQLAAAIKRIAARTYADRQSQNSAGDIYVRWYPMVLIVALGGGGGIVMVFVMPKFERIFLDFRLNLPPITRAVITIYRDCAPMLSMVSTVILAVMLAQLVADAWLPGWAGLGPFRRVTRRVLWWTPLAAGAVRSRAYADALEVIADALASGGALADAALHAAQLPSNPVLQQKLNRWSNELTAGAPIAQSAARAGLPKIIYEMLSVATATSSVEPTLRFLARHFDARVNRTQAILRGAAIPMISFLFGAMVFAIVMALMMPLIDLINHISGDAG